MEALATNKPIKEQLYDILEPSGQGSNISKYFASFMAVLIILNVIAAIIVTIDSVQSKFNFYFYYFEIFSVTIFSIEYILRVWICTLNKQYSESVLGRLQYMASPLAVIDLAAILPSILSAGMLDLRFLRSLRLFRIVRVFKLGRYSESLKIFRNVIVAKGSELIVTIILILMLLVCASGAIYYAENSAQPEKFPDIPSTMVWTAATLTTVNNGNVAPQTPFGKALEILIAILGIGLLALPTSIFAAGFIEEVQKKLVRKEIHNETQKTCPHCGMELK